jgi:hypothetical protein
VVGGMIAATVMSLTFTPAFYVVMKKLAGGLNCRGHRAGVMGAGVLSIC